MSLGTLVRGAVESRVPFDGQLGPIIAREGPWEARCQLTGADRLGCAVAGLQLAAAGDTAAAPVSLPALATELCARVRYLHEPLAALEIDGAHGTVLIRSQEPRVHGDQVDYFELVAKADRSLSLQRFRFERSQRRRQPIDFVLSIEQLQFLIDDLVRAQAS